MSEIRFLVHYPKLWVSTRWELIQYKWDGCGLTYSTSGIGQ